MKTGGLRISAPFFYVFIYTENPSLYRKSDHISLAILMILRSTEYNPVQYIYTCSMYDVYVELIVGDLRMMNVGYIQER